jgi:hypothetical protein
MIVGTAPMLKFLANMVRGLHMTIGITPPKPEEERLSVFLWTGIVFVFSFGFALWVYLLLR